MSRGWGVVSASDLRENYARMRADPAFDPSFQQLGDLTDVTLIAISSAEVAAVASAPIFAPNIRRAFVAPEDAHYGIVRMFEIFGEAAGQEVSVFRDMQSALLWLGL